MNLASRFPKRFNPWVVFFYGAISIWLVCYLTLAHRYNGGDYKVYASAIERMDQGLSPYRYDEGSSFHYSPIGLLPFMALSFLPLSAQHLIVFLLSLAALYRMTWVTLKLLLKDKTYSPRYLFLLWISPWFLVNQGIGFQFESGNINLILLYIMVEGVNFLVQGDRRKAFITLTLPIVFKPFFGIVPYFLFCSQPKKHFFAALAAGGILALLLLIPFVVWGGNTAMSYYRDWWLSNAKHTDIILSGEIVNANLSILSYAYNKLGLSLDQCVWGVFFPAFVLSHFLVFKKHPTEVLSFSLLFLFLFSPATFPYSIVGLMFPAVHALVMCVNRKSPWLWGLFAMFLLGALFVNVNFMGRELYNTYAVPNRWQGWLVVPLVFILCGTSRRKLSAN